MKTHLREYICRKASSNDAGVCAGIREWGVKEVGRLHVWNFCSDVWLPTNVHFVLQGQAWGFREGGHTRYDQEIQFHSCQQDGSVDVEGELHLGWCTQHRNHYADGTQGRPAISLKGQHHAFVIVHNSHDHTDKTPHAKIAMTPTLGHKSKDILRSSKMGRARIRLSSIRWLIDPP